MLLKASPEEIRTGGKNLVNNADSYLAEDKAIFEVVNNLQNKWKGADNQQFASTINGYKENIDALGQVIGNYGVFLQETRKVRQPDGTTMDQWTMQDSGTLYVTNQRIVFVGDNGSRTILIKDILDKQFDLTSFKLTLANRTKPIGFMGGNPHLMVTMITAIQDYPDLPLVTG